LQKHGRGANVGWIVAVDSIPLAFQILAFFEAKGGGYVLKAVEI
jgi:hypothetical protein